MHDRGCELEALAGTAAVPADAHVYDVTLRDGAQTPGVDFSNADRGAIAGLLDDSSVTYIEAGYPARDGGATIAPVRDAVSRATVVGLADASRAAVDAVRTHDLPAVSVFAGGSDSHRAHADDADIEALLDRVDGAVSHAVDHGLEVRFAVTDAGRTPPDILGRLLERAEAAGATMLGLTDTVGVLTPRIAAAAVEWLADRLDAPISVHCHDDLGMAVGNSVAALEAGATQVHATVNGLGPGAGNTPVGPVATALAVHHGHHLVDLDGLPSLSERVARASGVEPPDSAPVVGRDAFRYTTPQRAARTRADPGTYEAFPPELVGRERRFEE